MMAEFKAAIVVRLVLIMGRMTALVGSFDRFSEPEDKPKEISLDPVVAGTATENLSELVTALAAVHAPLSIMAAEKLKKEIGRHKDEHDPFTYGDLEQAYAALYSRIRDELSLVKLLAVKPDREKYYAPTVPIFGTVVAAKFPIAAFDIDEACKSFALDRSTAAVFHLMRVLEIGIRALARALQIPDPLKPAERNWGVILKEIWTGIEKKWPTSASRMHGDGALFEGLHASLDAVKNPWRNATMHVETKYTDDEAEHILIAVRGFMKKLASRMDEEGKPLA
jgi:hypothetical protein